MGIIRLNGVKSDEVYISSRKGKANCFEIKTPNRTFFLCAESEKEREDWIKIIRQNINGKSSEKGSVKNSFLFQISKILI